MNLNPVNNCCGIKITKSAIRTPDGLLVVPGKNNSMGTCGASSNDQMFLTANNLQVETNIGVSHLILNALRIPISNYSVKNLIIDRNEIKSVYLDESSNFLIMVPD
jgi:hypothetical protein